MRSSRCNRRYPWASASLHSRGGGRRSEHRLGQEATRSQTLSQNPQDHLLTLVASSTLVSYSTNLTCPLSTISPTLTLRQSLPWNRGSPPLVGGLFSRSCSACWLNDGWREERGDAGMPRMFSAKLERWPECGLGLDAILRGAGGPFGVLFGIAWSGFEGSVFAGACGSTGWLSSIAAEGCGVRGSGARGCM